MAPPPKLEPNSTHTATFQVQQADLASVVSSDSADEFPAVFATARLIALMEVVCARMMKPYLSDGQLSVGVRVDVTHSAPTPLGAEVSVQAKYIGTEGKSYAFEVTASDGGGEIGRAKHTRAIVNRAKLENAARRKLNVKPRI